MLGFIGVGFGVVKSGRSLTFLGCERVWQNGRWVARGKRVGRSVAVRRGSVVRMSETDVVGEGDVVVIGMPYGGYSVALVSKVGGDHADVVILDAYPGEVREKCKQVACSLQTCSDTNALERRWSLCEKSEGE